MVLTADGVMVNFARLGDYKKTDYSFRSNDDGYIAILEHITATQVHMKIEEGPLLEL